MKNVLITGGSGDLGRSIAYKIAEQLKNNCLIILHYNSNKAKAEQVANDIKNKYGFEPTVINPRFMTGIDEELLDNLKDNHKLVITLEDGELDGGFGEKIARFYGSSDVRVMNYGAKKEFTDRVSIDELYEKYRIRTDLIIEDIESLNLFKSYAKIV